jgi:hypothetical protein
MEKIEEIAAFCVGRAVFFGSLAIACVMVGFSFNPVSSLRSGAFMTLIMAAILFAKAASATRQNPKSTEVWLYLDQNSRPADGPARQVFAQVMRETYGRFAQKALAAAVAFFLLSVLLQLLGFEPFQPPRA